MSPVYQNELQASETLCRTIKTHFLSIIIRSQNYKEIFVEKKMKDFWSKSV